MLIARKEGEKKDRKESKTGSETNEVKKVNGWRMRWEVSNVPWCSCVYSLTEWVTNRSGIMGICGPPMYILRDQC